ncbi:MAG: hypothetical protein AAF270_09170 [Pseudomonadota bacterium]
MSKMSARVSHTLNLIAFLAPTLVLLWLMRSGALAIWDRHSPVKETAAIPWLIAVPVAIVGGGLIMPLLAFQISVLVDWWRNRRRG